MLPARQVYPEDLAMAAKALEALVKPAAAAAAAPAAPAEAEAGAGAGVPAAAAAAAAAAATPGPDSGESLSADSAEVELLRLGSGGLAKLRVVDLKRLLKPLGLTVGGKKQQLIERLGDKLEDLEEQMRGG